MKYVILMVVFFSTSASAQNRVNKLSLSLLTNLYSYGEGQDHLNNVVRLGEGFGFTYKTYDTVKKRGMIYELMSNITTAYYKNILSASSVLEVNDLHLNLNLILPIIIFYKRNMEHSLGVGIGIGTLIGRDYLDENNNILAYNTTNLKELKFGKYYTSSLMLDYEFNLKFTKKIGMNVGIRYSTATPVQSNRSNYLISQGTGLGFKYGVFYQFK